MSYYRICTTCGAHLDPDEVCECKKEAALGATNTGPFRYGFVPDERVATTAEPPNECRQ